MNSELDIYNKIGGGKKYTQNKTKMNKQKKSKKEERITRLEKKIEILQNELRNLKEN